MSLSNAINDKAAAPTTAPTAPKTAKKAGQDARHEQLVANGSAIREKMSDEEKQIEGSKSGTIAYVGALGDPNKPQARKQNSEDIPSFTVVGYAFKALEDTVIPVANLKSGFKNFMDVEPMTEKTVKAGETFYLNIFETGTLISKPAYAGTFNGEGDEVFLTVKYAQNREEPLPVLKKAGKGSVKENMILIAEMVGADPANKVKGTPKIKDEFAEKFSVLYEKRVAGKKGSSAGAKKAGESTKDIAAAFNAYINSRQ